MNEELKLQQLWNHLEVQDDERLIVQSYSREKGSDEFYVVESTDGGLKIGTAASLMQVDMGKPFRLIRQLGSDGRHTIPSVRQMKRDELLDY